MLLNPCVCFYIFDRTTTFPKLDRVALCGRNSVWPSNTASQSPELGTSGVTPVWAVCTILLYLSLVCCWHITGRDLLPGQSAARTSYDYSKGAAVQGLILWSRTCFMGLWFPPSLPLKYVAHECGRVIIFCGLKLSTGCSGSGASWEVQG